MKTKKVLLPIALVFLIFLIFYFDGEIVKFFSSLRNAFTTEILLGITFLSSEIIIFFFLTSLFLWQEKKRRWIFPLWMSLFFSVIVSFILKISIHRLRPFQQGIVSILPGLEKTSYYLWDFSMPSFHTMLAFSAIPILAIEFPKFKYVWITLAGLIAFSRIYFGLHFLSDVLIGGMIGLAIGILMVKLEKNNKYGERIYRKIFKKKK